MYYGGIMTLSLTVVCIIVFKHYLVWPKTTENLTKGACSIYYTTMYLSIIIYIILLYYVVVEKRLNAHAVNNDV